jgi:hypothetical protein
LGAYAVIVPAFRSLWLLEHGPYRLLKTRAVAGIVRGARDDRLAARQADLVPVRLSMSSLILPSTTAEISFSNEATVCALLMRRATDALMALAVHVIMVVRKVPRCADYPRGGG